MSALAPSHERKPWYHLSLGKQMVIGLVVGTLVGYGANVSLSHEPTIIGPSQTGPSQLESFMGWVALIRDIFLHLIQMMIAPLVFASIVQGIAGHEDMKKVGRIGIKTLIYFEVVTTFALVIGLLVVNALRPGAGVVLGGDISRLGTIVDDKPMSFVDTI